MPHHQTNPCHDFLESSAWVALQDSGSAGAPQPRTDTSGAPRAKNDTGNVTKSEKLKSSAAKNNLSPRTIWGGTEP